ncbi:ABC transporter ATP-binding protein [Balneolales bacterium ANBcel1]|nr:ABC transporter ATP-binding protein [Balneolales bacterium ANBcel1]
MTLLKEIIGYLRIFRKHLGNRLYIVFLLTALAVSAEALGIALLLPLLDLMDSPGAGGASAVSAADVPGGASGEVSAGGAGEVPADAPFVTRQLVRFLDLFGISGSMTGILLFIAMAFVVKGLIRFGEGSYKAVLTADLLREMKSRLLDRYSTMDYAWYTSRNTGHFINVISVQINRLLQAFEAFKKFLSQIIICAIYFLFAFLISWMFALMAAVAGVLILLLFRRLNAYAKNLSRKTSDEYSTLYSFLVQTLHAFPWVSATGRFGRLRDKAAGSIHRLTGYYRNQQIAHAFTSSVREPVSILLVLGIVILQISVFEAPIAPILVSLLLIHRAMGHVFAIQASWQQVMNMIGGLEIVEEEFDRAEQWQEAPGEVRLKEFSESIRLENVAYTYPGREEPALRNLSLQIEAHSTVALFGPSGSGKSTLVDLLTLLLQPQQGTLYVDELPHQRIHRHSWRSCIGFVPQEIVIFDDTIANNIHLWSEEADRDQRALEAAEQAYVMEFAEELPDGLDTLVGDRGVRLSGGQKQRIAIARELYRRPAVLILDEATSALDIGSEQFIHESIRRLRGEVTIVLVAHRLSTIRNADRIFLLEEGRLAGQGTFEELMASVPSLRDQADYREK